MNGCFRFLAGILRGRCRARDRRGIVAMEFALVSIPFFMTMLFILEISYDLYCQEALDYGLHEAVRDIQTGNAQNLANGGSFVSGYLCPHLKGLLECGSSIYVKVQKLSLAPGNDFYNWTDGKVPVSGSQLNLAGYGNTDFCNSAPDQAIVVSAIYLGPSFIAGFLPNLLSVIGPSGVRVHATLSTTGLVTENYTASAPAGGGPPPAKGC